MARITCVPQSDEFLGLGRNQELAIQTSENGGQAYLLGKPLILPENDRVANPSDPKVMTLQPIDNLFILNAAKHYQEYDYVFPLPLFNPNLQNKLPILNFKNPMAGYLSDSVDNEGLNDSQSTPSEGISNHPPLCGAELFINKKPSVTYYKNGSIQSPSSEKLMKNGVEAAHQRNVKLKPKKVSYKTTPIENCPHKDRKHYAKKMCYICYIKHGRTKKAWKCKHPERVLYAKGMCKSCYLKFNIESRKKAQQEYEIESPMAEQQPVYKERRVNKLLHKSFF